jgi:hypothetical protein
MSSYKIPTESGISQCNRHINQCFTYLYITNLHEGNSYPIFFQLLYFCTVSDKTELQVVISDEGERIKLPSTFGSVEGLTPDL